MAPYRNSRTGNARRAVSQPDHDILEGLPIRRWHKAAVNVTTATLEKTDPNAVSILHNGSYEPDMPKDSNLLPEISYAILRAARMGTIVKNRKDDNEEGAEPRDNEKAQKEEKPGLVTRKWALYAKDFEPKEPEYLAKRRKGLRSLYGGSTAPINTTGQMRKIKIRNVDSEGNSQIVEALVPEGQSLDAEIVEEELTSPTQVLAPGTKVEGVGVANAEGVLVPEEQVAPVAQRRRPPPPKRRLKGPGRGRKKKVAFAPGANGSTTQGDSQATGRDAQKLINDDAANAAPHAEGDNEGEDSIMQDVGQDGEEGSEDGSEGEEGEDADREEGEVSETPEASSEPPKVQIPAKQEPQVEHPMDTKPPTPPALSTTEGQASNEAILEQQVPVLKEEPVPDRMDESADGLSTEPSINITMEPHVQSEIDSTMLADAPHSEAHATPGSHPPPTIDTIAEPLTETSTPIAQSVALRGEEVEESDVPDQPSQDSFTALEEEYVPPPVTLPTAEPTNLPPKPPPSLQPDSTSATEDSVVHIQMPTAEQRQEELEAQQSVEVPPAEAAPSSPPKTQARPSQLPPPRQPLPEIIADSIIPSPDPKAPFPPLPQSTDAVPTTAPLASAPMVHQEQQEMSQPLSVESRPAPVEHHTPKAPTPSPPTPIATSFDAHQRERLMESPRAPTMSPPTPARDLSSSPDLPLAGHGQPPPFALDSEPKPQIPELGQQLPPMEERVDVEAAPKAAENFAAEIPHEHDPLDGLAAPKIAEEQLKEAEEPARFPDGEEDLLGSLERSLGK